MMKHFLSGIIIIMIMCAVCFGCAKQEEQQTSVQDSTEQITEVGTKTPIITGSWFVEGIATDYEQLVSYGDHAQLQPLYKKKQLEFLENGVFYYSPLSWQTYSGTYHLVPDHGYGAFLLEATKLRTFDMDTVELVEKQLDEKKLFLCVVYEEDNHTLLFTDEFNPETFTITAERLEVYVKDGTKSKVLDLYRADFGTTTEKQTTQKHSVHPTQPSTVKQPTNEERRALERASEYFDEMSFSKKGIIEQLEYEGFNFEAASYAAEHCGKDWRLMAVAKARKYMETFDLSYMELVEQLEYEGFTHEEALFGADHYDY